MAISDSFRKSAKRFCGKYVCFFNMRTFETKLEEFTFLRPNGGWIDFYKSMFELLYRKTLERVAAGDVDDLDSEAMLDDFEYILIRPYVQESPEAINHKPYAGMDRISRLMFLDKLTREAPSNLVDLYTEKYKNGELSISQMRKEANSTLNFDQAGRENYIEIAGYVQAIENVNRERSLAWRVMHPAKYNAEKNEAELMKKRLIESFGGEDVYNDVANVARETFRGHLKVNENLAHSMLRAREEIKREKKMNDAIRESFR